MNSLKRFSLAVLITTAATVTVCAGPRPAGPGIDTAGMDLSVRPQDDFFRYVNGKWADNTPIPADQSGYGSFAMLRERAQERVRAIIEDEARTPAAPGSNSQKVGDFYKSFMDESRIESLGITPLKGELAAIAAITDKKDLPKAFARASQVGVRLPFSVNVGADQRNSEQYAVQISQSGLGMPDRDYYLRNDEKFAATRKAYATYIATALRARQPARSGGRRGAHHRARDDDREAAVGSRAQSRSQRDLQQDGRERAAGVDAALRLAGLSSRRCRRTRRTRSRTSSSASPIT